MFSTKCNDLVTVHGPPLLVTRLPSARALSVSPSELLVVELLLRAPGLLPPGGLDSACAVQSGRVRLETCLTRHASAQLGRGVGIGHILLRK